MMITPALTRNERGFIIGDERSLGGGRPYTEQEWRKKLCEGDDSLLQRKIDKIKEREAKKPPAKKGSKKTQKDIPLEEAVPSTEATPKNITINPRPKKVEEEEAPRFDFFKKDEDGDWYVDNEVFIKFLLERGMDSGIDRGMVYLKDFNQYKALLDILAKSIYEMVDFERTGYGEMRDGQGYQQNIRIPILKKVFVDLLKKQLPTDDFNYDTFWSEVSGNNLTRINNVQMKKLFSNWKNKGKRYKTTRISESRKQDLRNQTI